MINWLIIISFSAFVFWAHDKVREKSIVYWAWVILFLILSGFRYGFPSDYFQYKSIYEGFAFYGNLSEVNEFGFFYKGLFEIAKWMNLSIQMVNLISFAIFFIPLSIFIGRYSPNIYVSMSLFFFIAQAYIRSVGNLRQSAAIGFFLIGFLLYKKWKWNKWTFSLLILIVSLLVHPSLLLMIPVLFIMDLRFSLGVRKLLVFSLLIISLFSLDIMNYAASNISVLERYQWYFNYKGFELTNFIRISRTVKLIMGIVILFDQKFVDELEEQYQWILNLYYINVYLTAFTFFIPIWPLERISQPLLIFELLTISFYFQYAVSSIRKLGLKLPVMVIAFIITFVAYMGWGVFSFLYLSIDAYPYQFLFEIFNS